MLENNKNKKHSDFLVVLIDLIPDPAMIIDCSGKIIVTNKMIEKFSGYEKGDLIGKSFFSLSFISEKDKFLLAKNMKDRLAGSKIASYVIRIKIKSGEVKCLKVKGNRFINEGEALDLAIFHDITEENKMQKKLRQGLLESEEKFQRITNSIKEALIVVNDEAKVTYWNPAAEKTFGYKSEEVIGKDIHKIVVPTSMCQEGKDRIAASVETFAQTGMGYFTVGNVELVGRCKDGSEFPAELSISPTKLMGKWNAVGVVKNIKNRKQAEQKLKDAEQRYHALFNQAPLGVLVVDPETAKFVEFNDIAHQQLGYLREEFETIRIYEIEAKESPDEVKRHMKKMIQECGGEFETEHRTKNGEVRNVLVTTRTFQSAGKTFLHCIFRDITESKKAQYALIESEAQYRQLVELAQEGIWALDNNFTTVFVNPRMVQMLGYTESEMIGKKIFEFIEKGATEKTEDFWKKFKHHAKGQFEYIFLCKNGTEVDTSVALSVITDDKGQRTGMLALISDITERKRLQTKLSKYSQKLEDLVQIRTEQLKKTQAELVKSERFAAIGELAGMVGHDLRNPLTGIKNSAYFMKKKGNEISQTQAKEMLETIDKCVNYSNKIINDLLDYSREIRLEYQEESLKKLLSESLSLLDIPEEIVIQNNLNDEPAVKVDSDKIKRVFINLIKNAIDVMPNGGKITFDSKQVNFDLEVSFTDTGPGITDEVLPKLFSPLFTTKAQGMGFGLAICKRIIEAHGGTITVKTVKDKGTTFTLTLPIEPKFEVGGENTWINIPESL